MVDVVDARTVRLAELKELWLGFIRELAAADTWWREGARLDRDAEQFLLQALERPNTLFLVARVQDKTAGYTLAERRRVTGVFQAADYVHISDLYVKEEFRRRGVAHKLLAEVENWTRGQGLTVMELNVLRDNPARQLYRRLGFHDHRLTLIRRLD